MALLAAAATKVGGVKGELERKRTGSVAMTFESRKQLRRSFTQEMQKGELFTSMDEIEEKIEKDVLQSPSMASASSSVPGDPDDSIPEKVWFKAIVGGSVVANAIQLGVQMDYPEHETVYAILDHIFTSVFTIEMVLKLIVFRIGYFKEGWNVLDFSLCWMSILDTWIFAFAVQDSSVDLKSFSILRILRVLRVVRAIRLLKVFKELWKICKGIIDSVSTVCWAGLLLILILYVMGIFCVAMVGKSDAGYYKSFDDPEFTHYHDGWDAYEFYGTVPRAMYTLFEVCLEPLDHIRPVIERQPFMLPFYAFYIFLATFGVMNVIVGVICENSMRESPEDEQIQLNIQLKQKMLKLMQIRQACESVDEDSDGSVSLAELQKGMESKETLSCLESVAMPLGLQPEELYALLDSGGDGDVTYADMMLQMTRAVVHTDHQQLLDIKIALHATQSFVRHGITDMREHLMDLQHHTDEFKGKVAELKAEIRSNFAAAVNRRTGGKDKAGYYSGQDNHAMNGHSPRRFPSEEGDQSYPSEFEEGEKMPWLCQNGTFDGMPQPDEVDVVARKLDILDVAAEPDVNCTPEFKAHTRAGKNRADWVEPGEWSIAQAKENGSNVASWV